jgi:hypothetical protein
MNVENTGAMSRVEGVVLRTVLCERNDLVAAEFDDKLAEFNSGCSVRSPKDGFGVNLQIPLSRPVSHFPELFVRNFEPSVTSLQYRLTRRIWSTDVQLVRASAGLPTTIDKT